MGSLSDSDSNEEEEVSSRASQSQVHERLMFEDIIRRFVIFLEPLIMTMSYTFIIKLLWLVRFGTNLTFENLGCSTTSGREWLSPGAS